MQAHSSDEAAIVTPANEPQSDPQTESRETVGNIFREGARGPWLGIAIDTSFNQEQQGFPKARESLKGFGNEDLRREYSRMLRGSFDRLFGHNAKRVLKLIEEEMAARSAVRRADVIGVTERSADDQAGKLTVNAPFKIPESGWGERTDSVARAAVDPSSGTKS
jgi:hypothetical protein